MENQKIQEMQMLEQNLQNLLLQKQAFQMELSETESALQAIADSGRSFQNYWAIDGKNRKTKDKRRT